MDNRRRRAVLDSPFGPLELEGTDDAITGLYFVGHLHRQRDELETVSANQHPVFAATAAQLAEYFGGQRQTFELPLAPDGNDFQQACWAQLRTIAYGHTISYGEQARRLGQPQAAQAVGVANGRNPISIIVPCHRVIGTDGSLHGYAGGLEVKRGLLELEGVLAEPLF